MTLSLNPPKGTADRFPDEFRIRKYIFDTRRNTCESFWYAEYLWPLVEDAAIREAKSWEDVWGTELTKITDREGKISSSALRPEMTPTVTRMVAKNRRHETKPVRRFSIANFYRNERPQRWRNREFRQCNVDMFGAKTMQAEVEVLQMGIEMVKSFGATNEQFEVNINHRHLIDTFLKDIVLLDEVLKEEAVRTMDKRNKMDEEKFVSVLVEKWCSVWQASQIVEFMKTKNLEELIETYPWLKSSQWYTELNEIIQLLKDLWYSEYIFFKSSLMRGFDYYDGMVFEVFDLHPDNNRAMFGGGRYNWLADIFGVKNSIPAVWFAPGDEPAKLFIESRGLMNRIDDNKFIYIYMPLLNETDFVTLSKEAITYRKDGARVEMWVKVQKNFGKQMDLAKKKWCTKMIYLEKGKIMEKILFEKSNDRIDTSNIFWDI